MCVAGLADRPAFKNGECEVVAINDLTTPETLAYLFKYDSVHGPFKGNAVLDGDKLVVNGRPIPILSQPDVNKLPWRRWGLTLFSSVRGSLKASPMLPSILNLAQKGCHFGTGQGSRYYNCYGR